MVDVFEAFKVSGDTRPRKRGWAPGNYTAICSNCGKNFIGDKRAIMCSECAYAD